eukprot:gene10090-11822_t
MSGDDRFNSMHNSATFKSSKKDNFKVKVDDRFKTLLSDERFQSVPGQVDRYGRKTKSKDSANKVAKEMREFYDIDEGEEAAPEQTKKSAKPAAKPNGGMDRLDYLNKLARGEISDEDSSDSDSSEDSDSDSGSDSDESSGSDDDNTARKKNGTTYNDPSHKSALQVPGQEELELVDDVVSTRIAIQNSDWENVSAEDLMVVLQSFCPAGGTSAVRKVTVYVSDFGKKRMELESRYGPQGIWKIQEEDDEDENNEDLYDQIVGVDEAEEEMEEEEEEEQEDSNSDGSDSNANSDSESEEEKAPKGKNNNSSSKAPISRKAAKAAKKGDFLRKNGAVGLVMHHDLKLRGVSSKYRSEESEDEQSQSGSDEDSQEESDSGSDEGSDDEDQSQEGGAVVRRKKSAQSKKAAKKQLKDGEGFDEVALRKYELSKLRYYFAVAECDSARTANMLYEELDGVEMESSAMVFDLSLVPEELSFEGREVRDSYSASASGAVNPNYKPPDFVVNALQHTKVQCSWDEGEKLRDRQLSNFSTWRNLNESELQQYVADSDSSDEEEEEEEEEDSEPETKKNGKNKKISKKKQSKAAMMRKMLLGGGSDESEVDDFFAAEDGSGSEAGSASGSEGEEQDSMYGDDDVPEGFSKDDIGSDDDEEEEDGEGKSMTYMPDLGKDILARKRGTEETPYEAEQRKMAEKKKARKTAKKAYQEAQEAEKKASVLGQAAGKKSKGGKAAAPVVLTEDERRKQAALELLFDEDGKDDYDMREVVKAEKDKSRGKKSNKRKKAKLGEENGAEDNFKIDTADDRFSKLFEGDSRFGIDKTSTEFRPTPAVQTILSEQTKRRAQKEKNESSAPASNKSASKTDEPAAVNVDNLVNKLKRKYAKA